MSPAPMSGTAAALVDALRNQVAFLQTELHAQAEARNQAEGELRRLMLADKAELQELRARLAITAAPEPEPAEETTAIPADQKAKRPWWRRRKWQ